MEGRSSERSAHWRNSAFKVLGIGLVGKSARLAEDRKYTAASANVSDPNQTSKKIF
jgi:hypothetical protein